MQTFFLITVFIVNSLFYNIQFQSADGTTHSMSEFQGKKILLVNIATGSNKAGQLARLQQLQQLYPDSLAIIGFPSNSFGKEARTDAEIRSWSQQNYGVNFLISKKVSVLGSDAHSLFQWLSSASLNGVNNEPIKGDFQKMLISPSGQIIGIFSPSLDPLSSEILNAIEQ